MPKSRRSKFLTTIEAAEYLRLVPHTLENMRWMRIGPDGDRDHDFFSALETTLK